MMLRHIFTADASPTRSEKTLTRISYPAASSAKAGALGPPSSMGERKPRGGTPVITAASTYRPPAWPTMRAASCFVVGETEFTSTTNGARPSPPDNEAAASTVEPAVTETNTTSAQAAASAAVFRTST